MNIKDVILELIGDRNPEDINDGGCEDFAKEVNKRISEAIPTWDWEMEREEQWNPNAFFFDGAHCFIFYKNKFYDSECPDGVSAWRDLPFFKRYMKLRRSCAARG